MLIDFRLIALSLFLLSANGLAHAQEIIGFPRKDFGRVVLSHKQFGGKLETSIGHYNNEPISKYGSNSLFATLGRPVGRLDILTDVGVFPCTAFLISEKHVLTNHHCVPGIKNDPRVKATTIGAIQLVLGYTRDGIEDEAKRFTVSITPAEMDEQLDYTVLEVFGNPSRQFGTMKLSVRPPQDNSPLWIIGHPMGEAQRISREDCLSDAPAIAGGRLRHRCDTLPGNSGSPVIDPSAGSVVALHHAGSSRNSINYAIPLNQIVRHSKIVSALVDRKPAQKIVDQPLSEAARTWPVIKDNQSVGVLETFAKKYKDSVFAKFARARIEELQRKRINTMQVISPKKLAPALQRELKRVGCYEGPIDSSWGTGSQLAMGLYNRYAIAGFDTGSPTVEALIAVRVMSSRVCPTTKVSSPEQNAAPIDPKYPFDGRWQMNLNPRKCTPFSRGRT